MNLNIPFSLSVIVLCINCIALGVLGTIIYQDYNQNYMSKTYLNDSSMCANLSLIDTSRCLRNFVAPYYNYTERPDTLKTWEDVKANGGDCFDYAQTYKSMAEGLNFTANYVHFNTGDTAAHAIVIVSDKSGYCVIDQLSLWCNELKIQ